MTPSQPHNQYRPAPTVRDFLLVETAVALVSHTPKYKSDLADRLSPTNFARISVLIGSEAGIRLPPAKNLMVEGRLRKRLRALQIATFDDYCNYVFRQNGLKAELPHIINALTTNKTDFFREPQHFELMRNKIMPELLSARQNEAKPLVKIWSAASSTGAEAYSCAMVLADLARVQNDFRFSILGTDISTEVLDFARRAIYPLDQKTPVPRAMQSRYLMLAQNSAHRSSVRIVPELRRLVQFHWLNLMTDRYPFDRDVDVILLRNVLIYFDKADQAKVIERLVGHLRPGGYLLLGHSESMVGTSLRLRQVAPASFQRTQ